MAAIKRRDESRRRLKLNIVPGREVLNLDLHTALQTVTDMSVKSRCSQSDCLLACLCEWSASETRCLLQQLPAAKARVFKMTMMHKKKASKENSYMLFLQDGLFSCNWDTLSVRYGKAGMLLEPGGFFAGFIPIPCMCSADNGPPCTPPPPPAPSQAPARLCPGVEAAGGSGVTAPESAHCTDSPVQGLAKPSLRGP